MSIAKKTPEQLKELKDTLRQYPHIEEVHFTDNGNHYFNKHEFIDKGKGTGKYYGFLNTELRVYKVVGERKFFKNQSVPRGDAEIVETLSRNDVLAYGEEKRPKVKVKAEE